MRAAVASILLLVLAGSFSAADAAARGCVARPAALLLPGWAADHTSLAVEAAALRAAGFTVVDYDPPAFAAVDARPLRSYLKAASAAYRRLLADPCVDRRRVLLGGYSLGGYTAAVLAGERPPRWLVLHAPANYPDEGVAAGKSVTRMAAEGVYEFRKARLRTGATLPLRALARYARSGGRVYLSRSRGDDAVPPATVANYAAAARARPHVLRDVGHVPSAEGHAELAAGIAGWLRGSAATAAGAKPASSPASPRRL